MKYSVLATPFGLPSVASSSLLGHTHMQCLNLVKVYERKRTQTSLILPVPAIMKWLILQVAMVTLALRLY